MNYPTYIDDPRFIPLLLELGWTVIKDTWTNCPQRIYDNLLPKDSLEIMMDM